MLKKTSVILLLILNYALAQAQGFDWQYSSRLPFKVPTTFVGVFGEGNYLLHRGAFNFNESYIKCCSFQNGDGVGFSAGTEVENWFAPKLAAFAKFGYEFSPANFIVESEPIPVADGKDLVTEYEYSSKASYLFVEIGAKYKVGSTHLNIAVSAKAAYLFSSENQYFERVLSREDWYWNEREIYGETPDLSRFVFTPSLYLGYDLNLGTGAYAVPKVGLRFPVSETIQSQNWKKWNAFVGISVFPFGI